MTTINKLAPLQACLVSAVLVAVVYIIFFHATTSSNGNMAGLYRRLGMKGKTPTSGKVGGLFGGKGVGHSGFSYDTYHHKPNARKMYAGADPAPRLTATPNTTAQWIAANAAARAAAEPRTSSYSQLEAPVVSSMDPHTMTQNPLDPYLENITYHLSTYRGRNHNFDPRGQPELASDFLVGTDQLVNVRNIERLAYHGPSHQITGCNTPLPPRY